MVFNILVSGSYPEEVDSAEVNYIAYQIGKTIIQKGYGLVSGMGLSVGTQCIAGAESILLGENLKTRILKCPFPYESAPENEEERRKYFSKHREDLVAHADIAFFISGEKLVKNVLQNSPGVRAEFDLCVAKGIPTIPIGIVGGMSLVLWQQVDADYDLYMKGTSKEYFEDLGLVHGTIEQSGEPLFDKPLSSLFRLLEEVLRSKAPSIKD